MTEIRECRVCGGNELLNVLDLGEPKFTGVFPQSPEDDVPSGGLRLMLCQSCGLVQLAHSFPPDELYGDNYGYRSGLNSSMVRHLERTVRRLENRVSLVSGDVVVDIGANDGTLLNSYCVEGLTRIGIDPTILKFSEYYDPSIIQVADFFDEPVFHQVSRKPAKLVTSIAMFYDLEDPVGFAKGISNILDKDGVWYFEQSYMPWMLRSGAYDTICHEHLEYYSLTSINHVLEKAGLVLIEASTNAINGGSISVTAARSDGTVSSSSIIPQWLMDQEKIELVHEASSWEKFAEMVKSRQAELLDLLTKLVANGNTVLGLGASTKGNVLLQTTGISRNLIPAVGDVNPYKYGRFLPGTGIPIISEEEILQTNPDYLLILPWHFRETFMASLEPYLARGGRLIFPLPYLEVVGY